MTDTTTRKFRTTSMPPSIARPIQTIAPDRIVFGSTICTEPRNPDRVHLVACDLRRAPGAASDVVAEVTHISLRAMQPVVVPFLDDNARTGHTNIRTIADHAGHRNPAARQRSRLHDIERVIATRRFKEQASFHRAARAAAGRNLFRLPREWPRSRKSIRECRPGEETYESECDGDCAQVSSCKHGVVPTKV
jgi:hypothetical protein